VRIKDDIGILGYWDIGILGYWDIGIHDIGQNPYFNRVLPYPKCYNPFRVFRQCLTKINFHSLLKTTALKGHKHLE
jgi:hypothetical protein